MKRILALALSCLLVLSLVACGGTPSSSPPPASTPPPASGAPTTSGLDFGPYSPENPLVLKGVSYGRGEANLNNRSNLMVAEVIKEFSGGMVVVEVYNDGVLADSDRTSLEGLVLGNWDISYNNTAQLSNYVPEYGIFDMMYLFRDLDHAHAFLASDVYDEVCDMLTPSGARMLAMDVTGFRNVYVNEKQSPITTAADMNGVMLRVNESELFLQGFRAIGASPVAMPNSETTAALQQGTVDGLDQNSIIMISSGYAEFVKHGARTEHSVQFLTYNIRESLWQTLTPDMQNLIREAVREAAVRRTADNAEVVARMEQEMVDKGILFTDVDKQSFIDLLGDYNDSFVPTYKDLYGKISALAP